MKNTMKRLLSVVLVCIMLITAVPVAFAQDGGYETPTIVTDSGETYNHYPQVVVKGFGAGCVKIYYEDDPEQKSLFYPFDKDRFTGNLNNIDDYIIESATSKNPDILHDVIYNYIMDTMGMLSLMPDGSNTPGVTTEPVGMRYKGNGKYEFYYDCRQNPVLSAKQLKEHLNEVFEETNTDKIEMIGSSYGANIVTAFMHDYPEELERIDTILLCAPSVGGMHFLGELLSGNFNVSSVGLCDYISQLSENEVFADFFYLLDDAGVLEVLLNVALEPILEDAIYRAVLDCAKDFLATLPTLWVCVPDEYFEGAMKTLYGEDYLNPDHTYAKLISEVMYYHYEVANKAAQIYLEAQDNTEGLNVALVTKFGIAAVPLYSGENTMDDGLVTLPVSSFGATCTTFGARLPADYKQQNYTEYNLMSPEWNIDASTGVLPLSTWYIKGLGHSKKIGDYNRFIEEIIFKDMNVFSDPHRPQYLTVSPEDSQMLIPLTAPEEEKPKTLYEKLVEIFRAIARLPRLILDYLFGDKVR